MKTLNMSAKILKAYDDGELSKFTDDEISTAIYGLEGICDFLSEYGDKLVVYSIANKMSAIRGCLSNRQSF